MLKKVLRYSRQALKRCRHRAIPTPVTGASDAAPLSAKQSLQRNCLPYGVFPSQFSINLGFAPCNHACLFCPQSVVKPKNAIWLDLAVLEKALSEMPEQNINLNISSYSETMKCPILYPAIHLMKKVRPKLTIVMATNGSLLEEENVNRLIDAGLDMLSYSFDAADRESYRKLMQADHFERVEQNLEMLVKVRNARKSTMKIVTHIMGFENQTERFDAFRKKWEGKVDAVTLRPVGNWGADGLGLKRRLAKEGFIPTYKPPAQRYPCTSLFMHFKLGPDGLYYPCVAYIGREDYSGLSPLSLGDARTMTFREAWQRMDALRDKHLTGKWDECPYCSGCDVWGLWGNLWNPADNGHFSLDPEVLTRDGWG